MLTLLEVRQPTGDLLHPFIELARLDLTENTEVERQEALINLRLLYGTECKYYLHICGHEETPEKPCLPLKEV